MFCPECGALSTNSYGDPGNIRCPNYKCGYEGPSGGVVVETKDGLRNFGGPSITRTFLKLDLTHKFRCPICQDEQEKNRVFRVPKSVSKEATPRWWRLEASRGSSDLEFWFIHHCEEWPKWQQSIATRRRIPTHSAMIEDPFEIDPPLGIIARILAVIGIGRPASEGKQYRRMRASSTGQQNFGMKIELLIASGELTLHSEKIVEEIEGIIPGSNEIPMSEPKSLKHLNEVVPPESGVKKGMRGPPCRACNSGNTVSTSAFSRSLGRPPVHHYHCNSCGKKWTEKD